MDDYKIAGMEDEDKIYCNCCGKEIIKAQLTDSHMDYLHIEKSWGYFSSKDLTTHSFNICETCYDKWVADFTIPVEEMYIEDIMLYSDEEISQLNEAYKAHLLK